MRKFNNVSAPGRLNIAVVGCGVMGRNHARLYSELKGSTLHTVVDPDRQVQKRISDTYGCNCLSDYRQLELSKIDAVSIAAPTSLHYEVANFCIKNGIPCLIEKPLADNIHDCQRLIDLQAQHQIPVLVGHIERFNPAYQQLEALLQHSTLFGLDIQRLSYSSERITDVDVIMDLMIHDLDITLALLQSDQIAALNAYGYSSDSNGPDYATVLLKSESGKIINLTASRITQNKLRTLQATTSDGHIIMDYTDQKIEIHRKGHTYIKDSTSTPYYSIETNVEKLVVRHDEPLANELRHFLACVRNEEQPIITPQFALATINLAKIIQAQVTSTSQPVAQKP